MKDKKKMDEIFKYYEDGNLKMFSEKLWEHMEGTGQGVPGLDPSVSGINAAKQKKKCTKCKSLPCKC